MTLQNSYVFCIMAKVIFISELIRTGNLDLILSGHPAPEPIATWLLYYGTIP